METLTQRQWDVTRLAAEGLTNAQIGERLNIAPESVKTHLSGACKKLRARNRAHLVHQAHVAGYFNRGKAGVRTRDTAGSRPV